VRKKDLQLCINATSQKRKEKNMSVTAMLSTPCKKELHESDDDGSITPPPAKSSASSGVSTPLRAGAPVGGQRGLMIMYGQRISLLGAVTSAVGALLAQEEAERRILFSAFDHGNGVLFVGDAKSYQHQRHHSASSIKYGDDENEVLLADTSSQEDSTFIPFEPLRVQSNALFIEEHELRWELVHEEHALRKTMDHTHVETMYRLSTNDRHRRTVERAVLEREATLRLVEIVSHWESQRGVLDAREQALRRATQRVVQQRSHIVEEESEAREITALAEDVHFRQELRAWKQQMLPDIDDYDD
jgi:hypothetical protein